MSYLPLNNLYKCTQLDKQTLSWFTANVLFLAYWLESVFSLQKYLAGSASGLRNAYKTYEKALRTSWQHALRSVIMKLVSCMFRLLIRRSFNTYGLKHSFNA